MDCAIDCVMNCAKDCSMDWTLFWTAFGAIGTTLGSLITAIAVVVAVWQYKQPLIKKLKIEFTSAFTVGHSIDLYCVSVANTGVRSVNISNIYLNVGKKNLIINLAQFSPPSKNSIQFPVELQPEQRIQMFLEQSRFTGFFREALNSGSLKATTKVKVVVTDQTGGRHYHRTGCTVRQLASL